MPTDGPSSFGMRQPARCCGTGNPLRRRPAQPAPCRSDRKSTRLNSSHMSISYAVFCLKQKINSAEEWNEHTKTSIRRVGGGELIEMQCTASLAELRYLQWRF